MFLKISQWKSPLVVRGCLLGLSSTTLLFERNFTGEENSLDTCQHEPTVRKHRRKLQDVIHRFLTGRFIKLWILVLSLATFNQRTQSLAEVGRASPSNRHGWLWLNETSVNQSNTPENMPLFKEMDILGNVLIAVLWSVLIGSKQLSRPVKSAAG